MISEPRSSTVSSTFFARSGGKTNHGRRVIHVLKQAIVSGGGLAQIERFRHAAQSFDTARRSGEQIASNAGQRRAMTFIGAAPHGFWSLRYRTEQAWRAAKPHSDFPRPADVTNQRVFLLARISQVTTLPACEQFADEIQHGYPPTTASSVGVGGTGKPRAVAAEVAIGPGHRYSLLDRFPSGRQEAARPKAEHHCICPRAHRAGRFSAARP